MNSSHLLGQEKGGHIKPVQHSLRVLYQFLNNPNIVERNPKVVRPGFVLSLSEILSLGFQGGSMFVYLEELMASEPRVYT